MSAGGGISIGGQVRNPQLLRADDLRKLPLTKVDVSYATGGQGGGTFSGVLLWTILEKAVVVDGPSKGALLRHVIILTGRDGYAVVLSASELAPDFEGKSVILALTRRGEPIKPEEGVRLIVPATSTVVVLCARW